jgi:hypothetical protein
LLHARHADVSYVLCLIEERRREALYDTADRDSGHHGPEALGE